MTAEEWKEVSRWYDHSLRSLMLDGRWYEHARCPSRESAYQMVRALTAQHPHDLSVIVHCTLVGKMGVKRWSIAILAVNKRSCESGRHDERTGDDLMTIFTTQPGREPDHVLMPQSGFSRGSDVRIYPSIGMPSPSISLRKLELGEYLEVITSERRQRGDDVKAGKEKAGSYDLGRSQQASANLPAGRLRSRPGHRGEPTTLGSTRAME